MDAIVADCEYLVDHNDIGTFVASAFDAVRGQILKLERRQTYREPEKPYDTALTSGDFDQALTFLPQILAENRPMYDQLRGRHIEFIRCRPVQMPFTIYTCWEIAGFRQIGRVFEDIYWCNYEQLREVFDEYATMDFLIFDARLGIIHKHDDEGKHCGSWTVRHPNKIIELLTLFAFIKANCLALDLLHSPDLHRNETYCEV